MMVLRIVDHIYLPFWLARWNAVIFWHAMDDGEEVEEGDFNFCEEVWSHCKNINYKSNASYEKTYRVLEG